MNVRTTVKAGSVQSRCGRCRRQVEMTRFVDPRSIDTRPIEERLGDWDPAEPARFPTIYKCTRCGHEAHAPVAA